MMTQPAPAVSDDRYLMPLAPGNRRILDGTLLHPALPPLWFEGGFGQPDLPQPCRAPGRNRASGLVDLAGRKLVRSCLASRIF